MLKESVIFIHDTCHGINILNKYSIDASKFIIRETLKGKCILYIPLDSHI